MSRVLGIYPAPLPHSLLQSDVRSEMERWLPGDLPGRQKLLDACEGSGVMTRGSLLPVEEVFHTPDFTDRNRRYAQAIVELGASAVSRALLDGPWDPARFRAWITVSCTGVMIPSPDVPLIERLGFSPSIRRLPMTELACVGGAVALSRGAELADAAPHRGRAPSDLVMVLAAELPSLNFQRDDLSSANAIATTLFGDGIVAAVLGPDGMERLPGRAVRPPRVAASRGRVLPGTAGHLGYELRSTGFHIVLSPDVPLLVRDHLRGLAGEVLDELGWAVEDIDHWVLHPGGEKVIRTVLDVFGLPEGAGEPSRRVLREWGNSSSAGVLLVLHDVIASAREGEKGLLIAFGPGFAIEVVALEW